MRQKRLRTTGLAQWFPTFFDAFLPWLILELFIPSPITQFQQSGWKGSNVIFAMTQIGRCGLNHNPTVALLRNFNKPLLYDT